MDAETKQINQLYDDFLISQRRDLAVELGRLLIEKKKKIKYGRWLAYIENELLFSDTTAQSFMNRFRHRPSGERTGKAWLKL